MAKTKNEKKSKNTISTGRSNITNSNRKIMKKIIQYLRYIIYYNYDKNDHYINLSPNILKNKYQFQ